MKFVELAGTWLVFTCWPAGNSRTYQVSWDDLSLLQPAKLRLELDEPESPSLPFPLNGYTSCSNYMCRQSAQTGSLSSAGYWRLSGVGAAALAHSSYHSYGRCETLVVLMILRAQRRAEPSTPVGAAWYARYIPPPAEGAFCPAKKAKCSFFKSASSWKEMWWDIRAACFLLAVWTVAPLSWMI